MRGRNEDGVGAPDYGLKYGRFTSAHAEMERFDKLPRELRDLLNAAPISPAIEPVLDALNQGMPVAQLAALIRGNIAKIPLSFVEEE